MRTSVSRSTLQNLKRVVLLLVTVLFVHLLYRHLVEARMVTLLLMTVPEVPGELEPWRVQSIFERVAKVWHWRLLLVLMVFFSGLALVIRVRRRWGDKRAATCLGALATLGLWLGIELLAAPFLLKPLDLYNYYFVYDVDHWPPPRHAGIDTNADRVRGEFGGSPFREEDVNLLFLGDSFTFGFGLESADRAFPALVAEELSSSSVTMRSANFAWTSASPILALRRLEEIGERYHPDLVLYCFDMTDFHDDLRYGAQLDRRGIYWFYAKVPILLSALQKHVPALFDGLYGALNNLPRDRYFHSAQPLERSRQDMQTAIDGVDEMAEWARARNLPFVLFVLPRTYQYSARESPKNREATFYRVLGPHSLEPFRFFDEIAKTREYPMHSLLAAFQETAEFPTAFEDDPHWNEAGHRVAAEAMVHALLSEPTIRPLLEPDAP